MSVSGGTLGSFPALASTGTLALPVFGTAVNYQMSATDTLVAGTGGVPGITVTLPAAPANGRVCGVSKIDAGAGAVTVAGNGGALIDGAASIALGAQHTGCLVIAFGGNWLVVTGT